MLFFLFLLFFTGINNTLCAQDTGAIKKQKNFEIHGTASASLGYYLSSAALNNNRKPYAYSLMTAPVITWGDLKIPFNFTLTEGSKLMKNPFVQFGINPSWKWIKLYAGWTEMHWSPTILNGKTFLGIGLEINPSLFRFGAMYGRFNQAVAGDTATPTLVPQYKRTGFGFKIGAGNGKNYVDLIFFRAGDVKKSLSPQSDLLKVPSQQNAAIGFVSHQSFLKEKIIWLLDGAVSAFSRNANSQLLDIGNGTGTRFMKAVIPPRLSTIYAWTVHTNVTYRSDNYMLSADYNRVEPEYQSMGVNYIQNDMEKYTLTQSATVAKGKVVLSFNEFFQRDDLNHHKLAKTNRISINSAVSLNLSPKFGMSISYAHYTAFQTKGLKELNDTTKLTQVQNMVSITPHYMIIGKRTVQNIYASVFYQRLDDLNKITSRFCNNNSVNTNFGYMVSITKLGLSFTPSFNLLYSKSPIFELMNIGPALSISKSFWKGKINLSTTINFTANRQNKVWNGKIINHYLTLGYRFNVHHSLQLTSSLMKSYYLVSSTNEYKGDLTYTYSF